MSRTGRFLFVTWQGGGNVSPLVALGVRLLARGHRVSVLGPDVLAQRFEKEGVAYLSHRPRGEWSDGPLRGLADDFLAVARRDRPDAVLIDFMQPEALSAAELLATPVAAYVHTLYQRVAVSASTPMRMSGDVAALNGLRVELGLDKVDSHPEVLNRAARVLVATAKELDRPDEPLAANVRYVGPLVEDAGEDAGWNPPGDGGSPLVHVCTGTVAPDDMALPVIQKALDACADLPVDVMATVSTTFDRSLLRVPPNAHLSGYVRHAAVLPHTSVFMTHAGLGSVGAALTFGVPMVCLPIFLEQPDNAAHVETLGAGRNLGSSATVDELRDAVRDVLSDDRYRKVAQSVAASLRTDGNGALAVTELEALLP